jgi:pantothenate kinase
LAAKVARRINDIYAEENPALGRSIAIFLPMDGYHLSRIQLDAMPDPATAHARRGAAFTFDAPAFLGLVKQLRQPLLPETKTIHAPSFDHAKKDPVAGDLLIPPTARVVVFEGNYLSLGQGEWKEAAELMDELWFVEVPEEVARKRLIARHVVSGIADNEADAAKRADENDLVNGQEIIKHRMEVHEVVYSKEDQQWTPQEQGIDKARDQ